MDTPGSLSQTRGSAAPTADKAANAIEDGARIVHEGVDQAASGAAGRLDRVRERISHRLRQGQARPRPSGHLGEGAVAGVAKDIRGRALEASDAARAYAKDEPMKALLIAAATGAILMGLLTRTIRSGDDL